MSAKVKLTVDARARLRAVLDADDYHERAPVLDGVPREWLEPVAPAVPDEPPPGAYQIGEHYVFVATTSSVVVTQKLGLDDWKHSGWLRWAEAWELVGGPDVPIVKLVPERAPESGPIGTRPNGTVPPRDDGPLPYPGHESAARLSGGGWKCLTRDHDRMPRFSNDIALSDCHERIENVTHEMPHGGVSYRVCSRHLQTPDGRTWHIAGCGGDLDSPVHAIAVWPAKEH